MKLTPKSIALPLMALCTVLPALAKDFKPGALRPKAAALPHGLNVVDWKQIRAEYEKHRHGAFPSAGGGLKARSFEQQWLSTFDSRGFTVIPDEANWTWGLELSGVAGKATVSSDVNRITYRWGKDLDEWFINDTRGLEHGFTLRAPRPELRLAVRGGLVPRLVGAAVEFVDASGTPRMKYFGLTARDADGRLLKSTMKVHAGQVILSVNDHGARYPLTIDPTVQQAYLKASNTGSSDIFGNSISISGDTIVVGAHGEDSNATGVGGNQADNSASNSGAAYVFVRSAGSWTQQAYLKASNTGAGDSFGYAVAISGDTIVVGAYSEDSNATGVNGAEGNDSAPNSGAAYVFVRSSGFWTQQAYLKASNTGNSDVFGWAVAISGDTIAVGAQEEDSVATGVNGNQADNSASNSGAVYVFSRSAGSWGQQAYLKASNTGANDQFGWSLSLDGDTLLVGAVGEASNAPGVGGNQSNNSAFQSGAAYVFVRSGITWSQQVYLKASNPETTDRFGSSVGLSGDTVIVGAPEEDSNATGVGGNQADNSVDRAGAAYVFVRSGATWTQQAYLKASNHTTADQFGSSVGLSGDSAIVGAVEEDSNATNSGAVYVFVRSGTTWTQQAYLKASNAGNSDDFGYSVAISGDTAVSAAALEDSNATGVGGNQTDNSAGDSGAVYVFGPSGVAVTIATSPAGLTFTTSGSGCAPGTYTAPQTFQWTPASSCSVSVTTPQTASGTEYRFSQWEDSSTFTTRSITAPSSATTYTATFGTYYQLTTSAGTGGTVSAGGFVLAGTNTSVTATPSSGYAFTNFTGSATSTSNPLSLLMDAAKSITANFIPLTITNNPAVLTFYGAAGGASSGILLSVTTNVSGSTFAASASASWLTVSPGSNASGGTASLIVTANPASLTAGTYTGTVTTNFGGVTASTAVVFNVANPSVGIPAAAPGSPFATGAGSFGVATADFNGDGKLDLASANENADNVTILLGNGSGGFSPASGGSVSVGAAPNFIATADFNGDGKIDFASTSFSTNSVSIRLGNGNGTFTPAASVTVSANPRGITTGDFNRDGKPDLAVAADNGCGLNILLGNGSGGFSQPSGSPITIGCSSWWVGTADLNGDGKPDLATISATNNNATFFLGDGTGAFTQSAQITVGTSPQHATLGDVNADGKIDFLVANQNSNSIGIYLGNGNGTFAFSSNVGVSSFPLGVAIGDLNGDGKADIAVANQLANSVSILLGNGAGAFTNLSGSPFASTFPRGLVLGDFDGDGRKDIAVANYSAATVSVFLSNRTATTTTVLSGLNPSSPGQSVTFSVAVSPAAATGSVTIKDGSATLGSAALNGGAASYITSALSAGTHSITAVYAGDTIHAGSTSGAVSQVVLIVQTITGFGTLPNRLFGTGPFAVTGVTGGASGNPVTFTATGPCTIASNGTSLTLTGVGTCNVSADQAGNTSYSAAATVTQSFAITQGTQSISGFNSLPSRVYATGPFSVTGVTGGASGNAVTFSATGPCTIAPDGSSLILTGVGTCNVSADQAGNTNYSVATTVTQSFTITQGTQSISGFTSLPSRVYATGPFSVTGVTGGASGNAVTFSATGPCTIAPDGSSLILTGVGTCNVTANQAGNANYTAAPPVTEGFSITAASATISLSGLNAPYTGSPVPVAVTTSPTGLSTSITYDGSATPPTAVGAYAVIATVTDPNYSATPAIGTLNILGASITLASLPAGRSVSVSGTGCAPGTYTTPQTLLWIPGSICSVSFPTPQAFALGSQYAFNHWENASNSNPRTITAPASATTYTATFDTQYLLTTTAGLGGSVSSGGYLNAGTNATITATPAGGFAFTNFTGATTSTSNPLSLLMDAPKSVTANFTTSGTALLSGLILSKADGILPNERVWTIQVTNNGTGAAANARVANVEILAANPAGNLPLISLGNTTFPVALANPALSPGQISTASVRIIFPVTSPATRLQVRITLAADNGVIYPFPLSNVTR